MKHTSLRPAHGGLAPGAGLNREFLDTVENLTSVAKNNLSRLCR